MVVFNKEKNKDMVECETCHAQFELYERLPFDKGERCCRCPECGNLIEDVEPCR